MRFRLAIAVLGFFAATSVPAAPAAQSLRARNLDAAFRSLDTAYPTARVIGGTLSTLTGAFGALGGFLLVIDPTRPGDEAVAGAAIMVGGSIGGLEGLIRLWRRSSPELLIPHYQRFPDGKPVAYGGDKDKIQFGEQTLERLCAEGKQMRLIRGALDLVQAAGYWYLFSRGDKKIDASGGQTGNKYYPYLVTPAAVLTVLAAYRLLFSSPEERAWNDYRDANAAGRKLDAAVSLDYFVAALPGGAQGGLSLRF